MSAPLLERFGPLEIAQDGDGNPIELPAPDGEAVCLAADPVANSLVELHLPRDPQSLDAAFEARIDAASKLNERHCSAVIEAYRMNGLPAYSTRVNWGEPVDEYVRRVGLITPEVAIGLCVELLEALNESPRFQEIAQRAHLQSALICQAEDETLFLKIIDLQLTAAPNQEAAPLADELVALLKTMLAGTPGDTHSADLEIVKGGLPMTTLMLFNDDSQAPQTLPQLLDGLREDLNSISKSMASRNRREHLHCCRQTAPRPPLEQELLPRPVLPAELGKRFVADWRGLEFQTPFTISAADSQTNGRIRMQILPPGRVFPLTSDTPPAAGQDLQVLGVLEGWEDDKATYVAEEAWPGFPLSLALARKGRLTPTETLIVLRQIARGLDQAQRRGWEIRDLRPSNLMVCFQSETNQSDIRKMIDRRIDCWPSFVVKLRVHDCMRALIEPAPTIESSLAAAGDRTLTVDQIQRRFMGLTIHLLTGGTGELPTDSLPAKLMELFVKCSKSFMSPTRFLEHFAAALPEAPEEPAELSWAWADYSKALNAPEPIPAPKPVTSRPPASPFIPVAPPAAGDPANVFNLSAVFSQEPLSPAPNGKHAADGVLQRANIIPPAPQTEEPEPSIQNNAETPFDTRPLDDTNGASTPTVDDEVTLVPLSQKKPNRALKFLRLTAQVTAIGLAPIAVFICVVVVQAREEASAKNGTPLPIIEEPQAQVAQPSTAEKK